MISYDFRKRINRLSQSTQRGRGFVSGKKILIQNSSTIEPQAVLFATTIPLSAPLSISITNSGSISANGTYVVQDASQTRWSKLINGKDPFILTGPPTRSIVIQQNLSLSAWQINSFGFGSTVYYRVTGLNPLPSIPPLSGWASVNSIYNPPPTMQYETPEGQVLAFSALLSTTPPLLNAVVTKSSSNTYEYYGYEN